MSEASRRWLEVGSIIVGGVVLDLATKAIGQSTLQHRTPVVLLGGIVRFEYAENLGAFLSLGASLPGALRTSVFVVIVAVALGIIVFHTVRHSGLARGEILALALVAAGGIGNLADRIRFGAVRDFVSLGIGGVRTGIFNLADVWITFGAILLLLVVVRR